MKNYKIVIISLLLVVVCTLCSCGNSSTDKSDKNKDTKAKATQQVANKTDDEDRMCLFEKDKNYEIYQYRYNEYSFEYVFFIYDNKHRRIDCKNVYTREPYISRIGTDKVGKNILRCYISNGTNAYTTQYYNVSNGKVSDEYKGEVCSDEKRVAYIDYKDGKTILEVKKIFDKNPFFEKELDMGGISTATFIGKGEFDGNSITITYAKGKNYKDVRETFSLNQK